MVGPWEWGGARTVVAPIVAEKLSGPQVHVMERNPKGAQGWPETCRDLVLVVLQRVFWGHPTRIMRLLLLFTLAWLLSGCRLAGPSYQVPQKLFWTQWVLVELQGESVPGTVQSSMQLSPAGQVTGNGGIHRYLAQFELAPDGMLSFSRPRCVEPLGPDWGWGQEERFLTSLEHSAHWWFYGPYLVIADSWNRPHLVFLPAE